MHPQTSLDDDVLERAYKQLIPLHSLFRRIFPLLDDDFSNLPPTVVVTADCDPISDDGKDYTDAVKAAGGRALWINQEGLVHGFLRARREVAGASSSFMRIIKLLLMLGKKEWTMIKK